MRPGTPSATTLSAGLVGLLAQRGGAIVLARGDLLFREGDVSESLFVVLEGRLVVFSGDSKGREVIYNTLGPGEILGEMLLDGGTRSASVKALTRAECIEVRESEFRSFMQTYPEFSEVLVVKLIERLRRATTQIRSLALEDVFERTIAAIDALAVEFEGERVLPAEVTQQQIAKRIGATREMVNHVFRRLARDGFLVRGRGPGLFVRLPSSN